MPEIAFGRENTVQFSADVLLALLQFGRTLLHASFEFLVEFTDFPLGRLLLSDVAGSVGSANDCARTVFNKRNHLGNIDTLAILPQTNGFEIVHGLTVANVRQYLGFFIPELGRKQH